MASTYWGNRNIDNKTEWDKRSGYTGIVQGVGVIDSRHHLKDDVSLYFGYDSDFAIKYDSSTNTMVFSSNISNSSDTFFSIREDSGSEIFGLSSIGEVKLKVQTVLPVVDDIEGRVVFYNGELYFSDNS